MPLRNISTGLVNHLSGSVLTLALCVRVERLDGTIMGFTTHDRSIILQDIGSSELVTYEARSSVEASAMRQELTSGVDNLEVLGLLQSDSINEQDIRAGLYDGASVQFFLVNWKTLSQGRLILLTGNLGEVVFQTGQFTAEIRSLAQRVQQAIGNLTSPSCRVKQLGDSLCKVNLASYRFNRTVQTVDSVYQLRFSGDSHPTDYFTYGVIEMTSGANIGFKREIKDHSNSGTVATLILQEAFPYPVEVGDTAVLEAGCDRRFATCRDVFDNVNNFRGEPHIPGNDQVLRIGRKR